MPCAEDTPPLPKYLCSANKTLTNVTNKLHVNAFYQEYEKALLEWLDDKIIAEIFESEMNLYGNYLPHRPVI